MMDEELCLKCVARPEHQVERPMAEAGSDSSLGSRKATGSGDINNAPVLLLAGGGFEMPLS